MCSSDLPEAHPVGLAVLDIMFGIGDVLGGVPLLTCLPLLQQPEVSIVVIVLGEVHDCDIDGHIEHSQVLHLYAHPIHNHHAFGRCFDEAPRVVEDLCGLSLGSDFSDGTL